MNKYNKKIVVMEGTLKTERIPFHSPVSCKHNCDMGMEPRMIFLTRTEERTTSDLHLEGIIERLNGKIIKLTVEWVDKKQKKVKPRVRFCWGCGRKLRGNHFKERTVDQHVRILHKEYPRCADE